MADWFEAIAKASQDLKGYHRDEVAVIGSGRMTNEELYLLKQLADTLETDLLTLVPRFEQSDGKLIAADRNPNTTGAQLIWATKDPYAKLNAIRTGVAEGKIKALVVFYEDLLAEARFQADDLENLDLLISNNILTNATAKASHVVLPGAGFAEKRGSLVNITGRLQRLNQAILPPAGAMDDWEILRDLIKALDPNEPDRNILEEVFREIVDEVEEFEELTLSKIGDLGLQITETGESIPLLEIEQARIARQRQQHPRRGGGAAGHVAAHVSDFGLRRDAPRGLHARAAGGQQQPEHEHGLQGQRGPPRDQRRRPSTFRRALLHI